MKWQSCARPDSVMLDVPSDLISAVEQHSLKQFGQHGGGAGGAVFLNLQRAARGSQFPHHGGRNRVWIAVGKVHATASSITLKPMRDVNILLKMILQRKIEE